MEWGSKMLSTGGKVSSEGQVSERIANETKASFINKIMLSQ